MTRLLAGMVTALMLAPAGFAAPAHADRITQSRGATVRAAADKAFDAAYNLNYDEAMRLARQLVAAHPDESVAHRALATVVWMHLLFDRGAFTIDHYLGSVTQSNIQLPPPPVERAQLFRLHVNRAIALADARLQRAPDDVEARYDLGVAHGLLASYIGTVDGKIASAFGSARRAYDAHEKVLNRDPTRLDAGLIVGTYRYAVAAMSLPKRWLAYIAGFGGGKERGIEMLVGATKAPLTATDARMALVLVYSREARQTDAFTLLTALMKEYPENRLLQLEAASAAWRAGRADQSEQLLTTGLARHDRDPRPKGPGERALWIYKRGMARVSLNRLGDATSDLQLALTQGPAGWVRGRVHLELGKIADLRGQRTAAMDEYTRARTLCTTHQDPWCREQADNFRKRPFRFRD
jgi:tetratricopeptide (TPR) repeat protein